MTIVPVNAQCYECRWFITSEAAQLISNGKIVGHYGDCRKRAPQIVETRLGGDRAAYSTKYPTTHGDDCCGEFEQHHPMQRYLHLKHKRGEKC